MIVATVSVPVAWIESVSALKLPPKADQRLQELMDRNNEGQLDEGERSALDALVELSEELSLVRATAIDLLRGWPQ